MSVESEGKLFDDFESQLFSETGVSLKALARRDMWGTFGLGYDSGVDIRHIVSALVQGNKFTITCPVLSGANKFHRIYIANRTEGTDRAIIFESPTSQRDEDICSMIGNVHLIREVGNHLSSTLVAHKPYLNLPELPLTSTFSWIAAKTPYDTFVPSDLDKGIRKLSKNHIVISSPDLKFFNKRHFTTKAFGVIDNKCFFISGHDYLSIFGDYFLSGEVAAVFEKEVIKRGGGFYNMLVRNKEGSASRYSPSVRGTTF